MAQELKTNTAVRISVGPFLDVTDGKTPETGMTVTNITCELFQEDDDGTAVNRTAITLSASGGNNDMVHITDDTAGMYDLELTAAQLNFLGRATLTFHDDDVCLPVWKEIEAVSTNYYTWKYGTGNVNSDVIAISGDTTAADNCELMFDGTGYAGGTTKLKVDLETVKTQTVTCSAGVTVNTNVGTTQPINFTGTGASAYAKADMVDIAGAAVSTTTAQIGANIVQISDDATAAANAESFFDGTGYAGTNNVIPTVTTTTTCTNLTNAPTNGDFTATMKSSITAAVPTAAANADAVWDEASTGHTDAGKAGAQVWTDIDAILTDTGTDGVIVASIANNAITAAAINTGAITNAKFAAGAIDAAAIAAGAIDNATFAADVGSTAFATNIVAQAVFKALDSAITDGVSLTAGGLLEKVRKLSWVLCNKMEVTDANGNVVVYKDDSTTAAYTVNAALTDDSTTTTRLRMA